MGTDAAAGGRRPSRPEWGQRPAAARRADHARAPSHHRPGAGGRAGDGPMKPVGLTVNAIPVTETVEPRMHLADLLRERLGLTGTHLRCEQGACGACTLLIDGQPARSCITYAVLCEGAQITTIEGLENDPVMIEHGLQCGFCTPGMLITARDIVTRLPDADERRVRLELSGNLCRCTGYVGIVRAIRRVLEERRARALAASAVAPRGLGPVGSRHAGAAGGEVSVSAEARVPAGSVLRARLGPPAEKAVTPLLGEFCRGYKPARL